MRPILLRPGALGRVALTFAFALACPATAAADASDERAVELFRAGNRHYRAGELREAEAAYQEAWERRPGFDIGASLGVTEAELGAFRDAAEHLAYSLRAFPMSGDPQKRRTIEETLAKARGEVGVLRVRVDVPDAAITLGGRPLPQEALASELYVEPGELVVEATHQGYVAARARVTVGKGQSVEVALSLAPERVAAPTRAAGSEPKGPGSEPVDRRVPLAFGVGTTAIFLGVGVFFTVVSNGKGSDAIDLQARIDATGQGCGGGRNQADCTALVDALDASDATRDAAIVGFAGAGVAAIATSVLVMWPEPERPSQRGALRARPLFGPGLAGAGLSGAF